MDKFIKSDKIFFHLEELVSWSNNKTVHPVTVELHLSNSCNNKCFYCCCNGKKDGHKMSKEKSSIAVDFVAAVGAKGLILSGGGEPTLSSNFESVLYRAKDKGLDIGVITNAVSLTAEKQKAVLSNASWIRVSLDSDRDELYFQIRGTHSFDSVIQNIIHLLTEKSKLNSTCTVGLQIVVNKYNYAVISDIVFFMLGKFPTVDYIQVRPVETKINENVYSIEELNEIECQLKSIKSINKIIISDKWDLFIDNPERKFGFSACHGADFIGAIDAHGNYYLCCHSIGIDEYKYCNIFELKDENDFFIERSNVLSKLGKSKGLNPKVCFLACRGSNINRRLSGLRNEMEHSNFI